MADVLEKPVAETAPARVWRNWWRCIVTHHIPDTSDGVRFAGYNYQGSKAHPSFDAAEAAALKGMDEWQPPSGKAFEDFLFYLGPYPEGESP